MHHWQLKPLEKHLIDAKVCSPWEMHGWCSRWKRPWSFSGDPLQNPQWCTPCGPCDWAKTFLPNVVLGWFWSRVVGKQGNYQESPPERLCPLSTHDYYKEKGMGDTCQYIYDTIYTILLTEGNIQIQNLYWALYLTCTLQRQTFCRCWFFFLSFLHVFNTVCISADSTAVGI